MAILSDKDLRKIIDKKNAVEVKEGPELNHDLQMGPSSYDLRLGYEFGILNTRKIEKIDTKNMERYNNFIETEKHSAEEGVVIHPGEFILGGTLETLNIPNNLVARVEGRSSYGRLGIIVHASLPYDEKILHWNEEYGYRFLEIGEIVEEEIEGKAVSFNPETKEVSKHRITDFIENPPKDIYRVKTEKGREVRITEDHNLFTVNPKGDIEKVKTQNVEGERVAIPRKIETSEGVPEIDLTELLSGTGNDGDIMVSDTGIIEKAEISNPDMASYYREKDTAPLESVKTSQLGSEVLLSFKQSNVELQRELELTPEFAYTAGLFLAEGWQRRKQLMFSNRNENYLDKVKNYFEQFDVGFYERKDETGCNRLTVNSAIFSRIFEKLELADKRIGDELLNMPEKCLEELYQGLIDGDASVRGDRVEYYTSSKELASDISYLCSMLGKTCSTTYRQRDDGRNEYRLEIRDEPHKLLQGIPTPSGLLTELREEIGITMKEAANELGYKSKSSISNLENREYDTVKRRKLQKIAEYYSGRAENDEAQEKAEKLVNLANSDLLFDRVEKVEKIAEKQPNYDLEVQPDGKKIENFLGGHGGIFLSNTAGYCDPGFEGDITLEMQNLGNAPVKLYPEDRVCQVVFETMTSEAENPYGEKKDSKYMGQTGATGSRLGEEKR
ncbi:MAG: deoxycytidine triphosphate deaminase/intein/homing endonuclease [Candidatus Nanohaloarchaea archaeon]|jgi:deoxycytidine triphosphate deaminase/intein/homing endonuclease